MKLHYGLDDLVGIDLSAVLAIMLPVMGILLILVLIALIDLYRNRERRNNKLIWTLVILFIVPLGAIFYFILGRKDSV